MVVGRGEDLEKQQQTNKQITDPSVQLASDKGTVTRRRLQGGLPDSGQKDNYSVGCQLEVISDRLTR